MLMGTGRDSDMSFSLIMVGGGSGNHKLLSLKSSAY